MADRGDVAELVIGVDGVEPRKRIPDSGVVALCFFGRQTIAASSSQSGSRPLKT
jgi:hypothetical protein